METGNGFFALRLSNFVDGTLIDLNTIFLHKSMTIILFTKIICVVFILCATNHLPNIRRNIF